MTTTALQQFRDRVEAFLVETGMKQAEFGDLACNDRSLVADLRGGQRDFRTSTIEKVDRFMARHREAADNVPVIELAGQRRAG
mgnify:CR=1 FL=1